MKRRITAVSFAIMLVISLMLLTSCAPTHIHTEGLDDYCRNNGGYSENHIASGLFLNADFVKKYTYIDGNFIYDYYGVMFIDEIDKAFAWLTYNEDEYVKAKQDNDFDNLEAFDSGRSVYGFTFFLRKNWDFPNYFTAMGFNDEKHTIVFIGFYGKTDNEDTKAFISLAKTDFAAFLKHFYGEWYNWE